MDDYNRELKERILVQARRIKELEFLLDKKSKPKAIKSIKSKQEKCAITKQCQIRNQNKVKVIQTKFWLINPSDNINKINEEISKVRNIHGHEKYSKYIKMRYYNNIESYNDIIKYLTSIYKAQHVAFKLQLSFGYACENSVDNSSI